MDVVEARAHFHHRGETIRGWALRNGFSPALVYAVLAGRITGVRGQAHHIAVALDLKPASPANSYSAQTSLGKESENAPMS